MEGAVGVHSFPREYLKVGLPAGEPQVCRLAPSARISNFPKRSFREATSSGWTPRRRPLLPIQWQASILRNGGVPSGILNSFRLSSSQSRPIRILQSLSRDYNKHALSD